MLLPTINKDGSVGEVQVFSLAPYIEVAPKLKLEIVREWKEIDAKVTEETKYQFYLLKEIEYRVGQKSAQLYYYVDREFEQHTPDREAIIQNIINMHSPWFFTYAKRKEKHEDSVFTPEK